MGSPVSANVANLVMEYVEESAISTAPHAPRWWYRYVDNSHACLQKEYVQEFHDHLNSINHHIQFTKEVEQNNCLSFLDTVTTWVSDRIQVDVYRKPTHTDKYLDFNSHHPLQHKRSVVNTLLDRAEQLQLQLIKVLRDNNRTIIFNADRIAHTFKCVQGWLWTSIQWKLHCQQTKINTSRIIHYQKLRNCVTTALTLVVVGFSACL